MNIPFFVFGEKDELISNDVKLSPRKKEKTEDVFNLREEALKKNRVRIKNISVNYEMQNSFNRVNDNLDLIEALSLKMAILVVDLILISQISNINDGTFDIIYDLFISEERYFDFRREYLSKYSDLKKKDNEELVKHQIYVYAAYLFDRQIV